MLQAFKTFDKVSWMFYFSLLVVKFSYFLKSLKSFLRISDQEVVTHILQGNFVWSSATINGWLHEFLWAASCLKSTYVKKTNKK